MSRKQQSTLDTVMIDGKPIGKCTVSEAREWLERERDTDKRLNEVADDPRLLWRLAGIFADRGHGHLAELVAEYSKDLRDKYATEDDTRPPL